MDFTSSILHTAVMKVEKFQLKNVIAQSFRNL